MTLTHSDIAEVKQAMDELVDFRENTGLSVESATVRLSSTVLICLDMNAKDEYELKS